MAREPTYGGDSNDVIEGKRCDLCLTQSDASSVRNSETCRKEELLEHKTHPTLRIFRQHRSVSHLASPRGTCRFENIVLAQ